ncbi:MAG: hypothetical protein ACOYMR_16195 [Ilumatobacteraceae bacterium]
MAATLVPAVQQLTSATTVEAAGTTSATDESKIPHYYGPFSNYANSQQALADAVVTVGVLIGSATVTNGRATLVTRFATVGVYQLTAVYAGNANVAGSTSAALSVSVR